MRAGRAPAESPAVWGLGVPPGPPAGCPCAGLPVAGTRRPPRPASPRTKGGDRGAPCRHFPAPGRALRRNGPGPGTGSPCRVLLPPAGARRIPLPSSRRVVSAASPKTPSPAGWGGAEGTRDPPLVCRRPSGSQRPPGAAPTSRPACLVLQPRTWGRLHPCRVTQHGFVRSLPAPLASPCLAQGRDVAVLRLHVMRVFLRFGTGLSQARSNPYPRAEMGGDVPLQGLAGGDTQV